ncbi:transmembrane protein 35B-like [Branchiostoma floridae x Branchiostoma belcheri]
MASVGGIVATVLSVLVGLVFAFSGSVKLFPAVNPEFHQEMVSKFATYSPIFPLADITGFRPPPVLYRQVVGSLELISGPGIILFPSELKTICNGILFVIMCGATYTHFVLGEPFVVPLVLGAMLGCIYFLRRQEELPKEKAQ